MCVKNVDKTGGFPQVFHKKKENNLKNVENFSKCTYAKNSFSTRKKMKCGKLFLISSLFFS
ncbi:MAG: hypothetical protein EAZ55_00420 [Cytophagales bacterium]|nr:MAG: hypothetical protein EAZ55_00420 [Cytophagales bacterium]